MLSKTELLTLDNENREFCGYTGRVLACTIDAQRAASVSERTVKWGAWAGVGRRAVRDATLVLSWGGTATENTVQSAECVPLTAHFAMFWILRRTRLTSAAAFFNTINNNNQTSNNSTGKFVINFFFSLRCFEFMWAVCRSVVLCYSSHGNEIKCFYSVLLILKFTFCDIVFWTGLLSLRVAPTGGK
jgi:hypothetical protein